MNKCAKCGIAISDEDFLCVKCLLHELEKKISGTSELADSFSPFAGTKYDSSSMVDVFGNSVFDSDDTFDFFSRVTSEKKSFDRISIQSDSLGNLFGISSIKDTNTEGVKLQTDDNSKTIDSNYDKKKENQIADDTSSNDIFFDSDATSFPMNDNSLSMRSPDKQNQVVDQMEEDSVEVSDLDSLFGSKDYSSLMENNDPLSESSDKQSQVVDRIDEEDSVEVSDFDSLFGSKDYSSLMENNNPLPESSDKQSQVVDRIDEEDSVEVSDLDSLFGSKDYSSLMEDNDPLSESSDEQSRVIDRIDEEKNSETMDKDYKSENDEFILPNLTIEDESYNSSNHKNKWDDLSSMNHFHLDDD